MDEPLDRRQTETGSGIFLGLDHKQSTAEVSFLLLVSLLVYLPVIFSDSVCFSLLFLFLSLCVSPMTWLVILLQTFEVCISTNATRADKQHALFVDVYNGYFQIRHDLPLELANKFSQDPIRKWNCTLIGNY